MTMAKAVFPPLTPETPPIRIDEQGVARIGPTRVTLDTLVLSYTQGADAEEIRYRFPVLNLADIHGAIAYYLGHQDEVEAYLAARLEDAQQTEAEVRRDHPTDGLRERLMARLRGRE